MTVVKEPKGVASGIPVWCEHTSIVDPKTLNYYPDNPNNHPDSQLKELAKVIRGNGWRWPIKVSSRSGYVVSGNGRLKCALEFLKVDEVPVDIQWYEDEAAEANDLLADNHLPELANVNEKAVEELRARIAALGKPDLTGYDDAAKHLKDKLKKQLDQRSDEDGVVEPKRVVSQLGDIWVLGDHIIVCGDCTVRGNVDALFSLGKSKVDMLLADPPYGVDYSDKNKFLNRIQPSEGRLEDEIVNDSDTDYSVLYTRCMEFVPWADYNTMFVFMSNKELHTLRMAMESAGAYWGDYLCWLKNQPVLGRKDYLSQFELIAYGWHGKHKFYGKKTSSVLEYDRVRACDVHPTMKPVPLLERLINDGCPEGGVVYDPFLGSGSTLMACHTTGRVCRAFEIKPIYIDVAVKRFVAAFGGADVYVQRGGEKLAYNELFR